VAGLVCFANRADGRRNAGIAEDVSALPGDGGGGIVGRRNARWGNLVYSRKKWRGAEKMAEEDCVAA